MVSTCSWHSNSQGPATVQGTRSSAGSTVSGWPQKVLDSGVTLRWDKKYISNEGQRTKGCLSNYNHRLLTSHSLGSREVLHKRSGKGASESAAALLRFILLA